MSKRNDIKTPEGYFGNLQERLLEIPARPARVSTVRRLAPYVAIAASFLVAVMLGNFILSKTAAPSPEDDTWTYVSYLADALDPDGAALNRPFRRRHHQLSACRRHFRRTFELSQL